MPNSRKVRLAVKYEEDFVRLKILGDPGVECVHVIANELQTALKDLASTTIMWDLSELKQMDSALALLIVKDIQRAENSDIEVLLTPMENDVEKMLNMAKEHAHFDSSFEPKAIGFIESVGTNSVRRFKDMGAFFGFFGQMSIIFFNSFYHLRHMRWKETVFEIHESGIKALPIIALTMFLIGVVVAYQSASQLKIYGANIFIVDMLGISILRELAPMLAAIIIAGRSGSSYAAQIGVMKITEELDAMRTMGFDPYAFLVLPRMMALMIMMPILIFFADIAGVIGGMLIAKVELGLSPSLFLERFVEVVKVKHFWIGIVKGPFFALLIATIGIYRGLQVKNDTQSIGFNTTKAVVESIFAVIICDAFFSIVFTNLGY